MKYLPLAALLFVGLQQQVAEGQDTSVYYNDRGVDLTPWIEEALTVVKRAWLTSFPRTTTVYAGHTAMGLSMLRDGRVVALGTLLRSGVPNFDNAAEKAIRQERLPPLPIAYPDETFEIVIVFWVNERPYDIFDDASSDVLETLRRAKPNVTGKALVDAAARGDVEQVTSALRDGAGVEARDDEGLTALMIAAGSGHFNVVRVLIEAGADVNAETEEGLNALSYALGSDVRTLLEHNGANEAWDTQPQLLYEPPSPSCPSQAEENRISGEVVLRIKVRTDGSTKVVEVIESLPSCDGTARNHAEQFRWKPAEKGGEPIVALGVLAVSFDVFSQGKQ